MSTALPVHQPLSPYVAGLADTFAHEVRVALGITETPSPLVILERPKDGRSKWLLRLEFREGPRKGLVLELFEATTDRPAWKKVGPYSLSYRRLPDGREPFEIPEHAALMEGLKNRLATNAAEALGTALSAFLPWLGIDDEMLRQVSGGHAGVVATLRLGFRCNQDCSFCWQDRDWPEPPAGHYYKWVDEMAAQGVTILSISGGEPTIHKELAGIVAYATSKKMFVTIQTNAIRLRKKDYLAKLVEAGLSGVFVSLHAPVAEVSDAMTRARGTFQPTIEGIEACLGAGLRVRLNCVVEEQNYRLCADLARLIRDRFVQPFPMNPALEMTYTFPSAYWSPEEWKRALVPLDELRPYVLEAVHVLTEARVDVQATGTCGFPPCLLVEAPEAMRFLAPESVSTLDGSGRRYGKGCEPCVMKARCLGIRHEYLQIHGDRGVRPFEKEPPVRTIERMDGSRIEPV